LAKKPKTYRAEAVIELPTPVLLESAFLGLLRPAVIGGVPVHVVLPDFDRSGNETILHRRSHVNWVESLKTKPPGKVLKGRHELILSFGSAPKITPVQWGKILKAASSGVTPPEAHLFLRDARRELGTKRYRRSVLDAATATEIALTKLRDDALAGSDPKLGEYVKEKAQQIGRLVEFLKKQHRDLPRKIQQEIGEPRNRAIHEGREPDEETATKALEKAEEVLDLASPWKKLL
jgi:HEPN domain-containing protein